MSVIIERSQNAALHEVLVLLAGEDLDNAAEGGDSHVAVKVFRARLRYQFLSGISADSIGERVVQGIVDARKLSVLGQKTKAGTVAHQFPNRGRVLRRMNLYAPVRRLFRYLDSLEFRQVILYGAREVQQSLIYQDHCGDAGHRLGLRHNLHNRIGPHFSFVLDIGEPGGIKRGNAAVAPNQRDNTRDVAAVDELLHALGNQLQGRGIQRGLGGGRWKREH